MADITPSGWPGNMFLQTVTIASGASASEMIATQGRVLLGIFTPAAWTDAAIGYKVGWNGNPNNLVWAYDNGKVLEQTKVSTDLAATSGFVAIPQSDAIKAPYIQLNSVVEGATTATTQGAARTLVLVFCTFLS